MKSQLTLIQKNFNKRGNNLYGKYMCSCGNIKIIRNAHVNSGNTKSCGCQKKFYHSLATSIHGMTKTRLYRIWVSMRRRCREVNSPKWKNYGGRGISVCKVWQNSFLPFYKWAIKNGYTDKLQIDRRNNDGNYKPSNCRWTTVKGNANNRRSSFGEKKIKEIKTLLVFGFSTLMVREMMGGGAVSHIRAIRDGKIHSDIVI